MRECAGAGEGVRDVCRNAAGQLLVVGVGEDDPAQGPYVAEEVGDRLVRVGPEVRRAVVYGFEDAGPAAPGARREVRGRRS